jgi:flagellin
MDGQLLDPNFTEEDMPFALNTNAASMNIVANLALSQAKMHNAMERVSSGLRVVNAADDASGMALHTSLTGQIAGFQAANRNAQDGISIAQTADGAMAEIGNLLTRAYQVALNLQNAAGTTGAAASGASAELDKLGAAITFIKNNTYWGGTSNLVLTLNAAVQASTLNTVTLNASYTAPTVSSATAASAILTNLDALANGRATMGSLQRELEGIVAANTVAISNLQASDSRVADADMASEIADVTRLSILGQAGTAMLAQANKQNQNVLTLLQ